MLFEAKLRLILVLLGLLAAASSGAQVKQSADLEPAPLSTENSAEVLIERGFDWVLSTDPARYTLQILAAVSTTQALDFVETHQLQSEVHIYPAESQSRLWYKLVYGNFESEAQALKARDQLPGELRSLAPWVRQFAGIQNELVYPASSNAPMPVLDSGEPSRPSSVDYVHFPLSPSNAARSAAGKTAQPGGVCVISGERIIQETNNACEGLVPRR